MTRPSFISGALAGVVLLLGGCSGDRGPERAQPVAACSLPPAIDTVPEVPVDFPWPDGITLTRAELKKKFVSLEGFGDQSVEQFFASSRAELGEKGFDVINTDFEGFEAELYFAKKDSLAGIVALREAPCDGYVKVTVLYDPLETEAGRKAVRRTRRLSGEG